MSFRHCLEAEKKDLTFLTFLTSDLFFCSKTGKLFRGKKNSETSDFSDLTSVRPLDGQYLHYTVMIIPKLWSDPHNSATAGAIPTKIETTIGVQSSLDRMHHQRRPTSTAKVDFSSPPKRHKKCPRHRHPWWWWWWHIWFRTRSIRRQVERKGCT